MNRTRINTGNVLICLAVVFVLIALLEPLSANELRDSFKYISPMPGAQLVSRETNIILKPGGLLAVDEGYLADLARIEGTISGIHDYQTIVSDDSKTILLEPYEDFEPGETVIVSLKKRILTMDGSLSDICSFGFAVSPKTGALLSESDWLEIWDEYNPAARSESMPEIKSYLPGDRDVSLPSDFPPRNVSIVNEPDSGYIFLCTRSNASKYLMILDNSGYPVYYKKMTRFALDFKKHSNNLLTYNLFGHIFYAMDSTYTVVDSFQCGNGYDNETDVHDIQFIEDNHVLLMAYDAQIVDMSEIVPCGDPNATVIGLIIQELDQDKNVIFQWRSWDHFQITDATEGTDLCASRIDYVHGNAVELDFDGNLLLSSRRMDEITKIDRQTGDIIWRLGGENNEFTFVNDTLQFSWQHDIRRVPNGNVTIYDNGVFRFPAFSRAIEYSLDEESKIATLAWEYRNAPDLFGFQNGNAQRLSNENTMVGWGGPVQPTLTEVHRDSTKAFEMTFGHSDESFTYRAFRFPWHGKALKPYLVVEQYSDLVHLIFNKFGDSDVARYYIYGGVEPEPIAIIDSTSNNYIDLTDLPMGAYYFRVTAVDSSGSESQFSNEETINVALAKKYLPGDANMALGSWPPLVIGSDATYLLNYFDGAVTNPACFMDGFYCSGDVNADCMVIGSDITRLIMFFRNRAGIEYCPDYPPAWPSANDLPPEAPSGWPNCD